MGHPHISGDDRIHFQQAAIKPLPQYHTEQASKTFTQPAPLWHDQKVRMEKDRSSRLWCNSWERPFFSAHSESRYADLTHSQSSGDFLTLVLASSHDKDSGILGSILGSPYFGQATF